MRGDFALSLINPYTCPCLRADPRDRGCAVHPGVFSWRPLWRRFPTPGPHDKATPREWLVCVLIHDRQPCSPRTGASCSSYGKLGEDPDRNTWVRVGTLKQNAPYTHTSNTRVDSTQRNFTLQNAPLGSTQEHWPSCSSRRHLFAHPRVQSHRAHAPTRSAPLLPYGS